VFDKLHNLLHKPTLWERSLEPFWDDEHISKGMLEAHLNPDWDAASRRHDTIDRSVEWLSSVIEAGSKVLDIGCGPGLYTKRLANKGYDVTGIDYSRRSIEYARSHDPKTEYICQDYLTLDYVDSFDAITLIYCDYPALIPDERDTLLLKAHAALKPGGLFILDVNTGKYFANKHSRATWTLSEDGGYWSADPYICLEATHLYEGGSVAVDQYVVITKDGIKRYLNWSSEFSVEKLAEEVAPFGFQVKGVFDDLWGSPYTGQAETLGFILQKGVA
jgi:SAM-dependent methyltransferase